MNLWHEFLNDPVVFISFSGLGLVVLLCTYYVWLFMKKVHNNE